MFGQILKYRQFKIKLKKVIKILIKFIESYKTLSGKNVTYLILKSVKFLLYFLSKKASSSSE